MFNGSASEIDALRWEVHLVYVLSLLAVGSLFDHFDEMTVRNDPSGILPECKDVLVLVNLFKVIYPDCLTDLSVYLFGNQLCYGRI